MGTHAGWSRVVAYGAPGAPARNLTVFGGYAVQQSTDPAPNSPRLAVSAAVPTFSTGPTPEPVTPGTMPVTLSRADCVDAFLRGPLP
jgi:hypothetical protein